MSAMWIGRGLKFRVPFGSAGACDGPATPQRGTEAAGRVRNPCFPVNMKRFARNVCRATVVRIIAAAGRVSQERHCRPALNRGLGLSLVGHEPVTHPERRAQEPRILRIRFDLPAQKPHVHVYRAGAVVSIFVIPNLLEQS